MSLFLFWLTAEYQVSQAAKSTLIPNVNKLPTTRVALVLGTTPRLKDGRPNLYFTYRVKAAATCYKAGKVKHLLLSGDNSKHNYDEPTAMRDALIKAGVPAENIFLDYAGFRTLDSIIRAKEVFDLDACIIISQPFHCERALYLAQSHNLQATAFPAQDIGGKAGLRQWLRERLARTRALYDTLAGTEPRFYGDNPYQGRL